MKKRFIFKKPTSRIVLRYCFIAFIFLLVCAVLIPTLLNYAPGSINTPFDIKMSYISYAQQLTIIGFVILLIIFISTKLCLRDVDNWYTNKDKRKEKNTIEKIRKKCFNIPYIIYIIELFLPTLGILGVVLLTGSHHGIMVLKIFVLTLSLAFLLATFTYIFSKNIYAEILASTYKEGSDLGIRVNLRKKIVLQIMPLFVSVLLLTSFMGYSRSVKEKEDIFFTLYNASLNNNFDINETYEVDEIKDILSNIELYSSDSSRFIIFEDKVITVSGDAPSNFLVAYTRELSSNYNGRTYDSYGIDTQGATIKLNSTEGICYVGISYSISSIETIYFLGITCGILLVIVGLLLHYFSTSITTDINRVTNGLNYIYNNSKLGYIEKLPVISNDEFGDLTIAFNKVQDKTKEYIETIRSNQETLMERERLASLGQLIGGIAHNLKTPIMSISGAAEGLSDLVKEYDSSIGDKDVTEQDHHDIAKDMNSWIEKIKNYTEYMSDVITAVKGQAVNFSSNNSIHFYMDELLKSINILMKHELKNALVTLNINNYVPSNVYLNGDVNSLVQVVNNMISNSIQAYDGKPNKSIALTLKTQDNNVIIEIKDYGPGMSKEVQNKLFKEMITTKGKNGTGLGLFISYSTIKAHFNGNLTCESNKNGTTFTITIPLSSDLTKTDK